MDFVIGQRWVSQADPQMGLGIVVETDGRHVTIHYPAIEEDRIYAAHSAPLARISYQAGDQLSDQQHNVLTVKAVEEMKGLLYYLAESGDGEERIIPEAQLSAHIELASPTQRLFSGQFDKNRLFQLRAATLHYRHLQQKSPARGLLGSRTSLLPHQVYIAHQIANRYAPRVLLADEVGLGKTIEAGMILHHQLETGMSSRCLIVVPEPLLHQWLVEMLRKFNLHFALFDLERYNELLEAGETQPFATEQLILCSMAMLESDPLIAQQAADGDWDMVIIDEAHHLEWQRDSEPGTSYRVAEQLAASSDGLLLLTATPEQVGLDSHFARLRLLDPDRYSDLDTFVAEQQSFVALNGVVVAIQNGSAIDNADFSAIDGLLDDDLRQRIAGHQELDETAKHELVAQLLDCHGTGRVLLRNTRAAIENFPERLPQPQPLQAISEQFGSGLQPELVDGQPATGWIGNDARVKWLEEFLEQNRRSKVLLICASAATAIDLEKHLHLDIGIRSTAFHEGLSILERDRAAAYFSDTESGAQVMICSEIGSEGRNFQFAHHLVLFDLPTNPDLLEQRIGRLDRIGQRNDIHIHIPYIEGSAQEYLYQWYQQGLDAFSHSFSAGLAVYEHFAADLEPWLADTDRPSDKNSFAQLLDATAAHTAKLKQELEHGRDHLLELNSCDPAAAADIIAAIEGAEQSTLCSDYMSLVFDSFGIEQEYHSADSTVIRPTEQMLSEDLPAINPEGTTITFNRSKAISREDMAFMTWEHPLVTESMDFILSGETGNCSIGTVNLKALPPGSVLLEVFYAMSCAAPKYLHLQRYLPETPIRVLIETGGKDLTKIIKHTQVNQIRGHLKRSSRFEIVKQVKPQLEKMIDAAQAIADQRAIPMIDSARQEMEKSLGEELQRLQRLQLKNRSVRDDEIEFFSQRIAMAHEHFDDAKASMQALRVLVNTYSPR